MLYSILKAVSTMLSESIDPKVQCAKTIVDEILAHQAARPIQAVMYDKEPHVQVSSLAGVPDATLDEEATQAQEELLG